MFRLLYTASERVAKRAGFCVDCWLRRLPATPLRFEPYHDVFPSWPAKEQVFVSIAGCADFQRRRCDLSRTTTFSHHGRHLQALPAVFARTSEAQRWLQDLTQRKKSKKRKVCTTGLLRGNHRSDTTAQEWFQQSGYTAHQVLPFRNKTSFLKHHRLNNNKAREIVERHGLTFQ
jgi:hypothetical protein